MLPFAGAVGKLLGSIAQNGLCNGPSVLATYLKSIEIMHCETEILVNLCDDLIKFSYII